MKRPVCIYVDNSNLYIGGQDIAKEKHENSMHFRIDFRNFFELLTEGKKFDEFVWAGSTAHESDEIFDFLKERGIELHIIPRSKTGEHETVDESIQLAMYRHCRKYRDKPGTIVLCTGDGKGFVEEKGFLYDICGFIEDGWQLKLFGWDAFCHRSLRKFAKKYGKYIPLETYYKNITFIKDERRAKDLNGKSGKKINRKT